MVQLVIQLWPELVKWTRSGVSNIVATHGLWAPGIQLTWIEMCSECKMHTGCWNQNKKENLNYFIEIFKTLSHWRICRLEWYHFSNYNSFDFSPFTVCNVATRKVMIDTGGSHLTSARRCQTQLRELPAWGAGPTWLPLRHGEAAEGWKQSMGSSVQHLVGQSQLWCG